MSSTSATLLCFLVSLSFDGFQGLGNGNRVEQRNTTAFNVTGTPLQYIGIGYNLLRGNPDGSPHGSTNLDEGLNVNKRIMQITRDSQGNPIEADYIMNSSYCHFNDSIAGIFFSMRSYQQMLEKSVFEALVSHPKGLKDSSFTLSTEFQRLYPRGSSDPPIYRDITTTCRVGISGFHANEIRNNLFSVSEEFALAVCNLPQTYDVAIYSKFIDTWGTSIVMSTDLGRRTIRRFHISKAQAIEDYRHTVFVRKDAGSVMGYSASLLMETNNFVSYPTSYRSPWETMPSEYGKMISTIDIGSRLDPRPFRIGIVPLTFALNPALWTKMRQTGYINGSCPASFNLEVTKKNINTTLISYATTSSALPIPFSRSIIIPVTWPVGTYGLIKTSSGCPGAKVNWAEGWRNFDTENQNAANHYSSDITHYMAGQFSPNGLVIGFCLKTVEATSQYDLSWPKGQYCLLQYIKCPPGFEQGYLYWYGEDDNNKNSHGGTMPTGTYNQDTKIYFCCRELRSRTKPADLTSTSCEDAGDLEIRFIDSYIGSGVFAVKNIEKSRLVAIYKGELTTNEEGEKRHARYSMLDGSFLFFFRHKKKRLCVDSTYGTGFGRKINDNHKNPNCKVVVEERDSVPTLCIYSIKQIMKGDQLTIDYKDPSAPWRKKSNPRYAIYTCPDNLDEKGVRRSTQSKTNETVQQFEDKTHEDEDFEMDDNNVTDPDYTLKESDYNDWTSSSDSEMFKDTEKVNLDKKGARRRTQSITNETVLQFEDKTHEDEDIEMNDNNVPVPDYTTEESNNIKGTSWSDSEMHKDKEIDNLDDKGARRRTQSITNESVLQFEDKTHEDEDIEMDDNNVPVPDYTTEESNNIKGTSWSDSEMHKDTEIDNLDDKGARRRTQSITNESVLQFEDKTHEDEDIEMDDNNVPVPDYTTEESNNIKGTSWSDSEMHKDKEIVNLDSIGASRSTQSTTNESVLQFEDKTHEEEDFEMDDDNVTDPDYTLKESAYNNGTNSSDSEMYKDRGIVNLDDKGASRSTQSTTNENVLQFEDKTHEVEDFEMDDYNVTDQDFTLKESDFINAINSSYSEMHKDTEIDNLDDKGARRRTQSITNETVLQFEDKTHEDEDIEMDDNNVPVPDYTTEESNNIKGTSWSDSEMHKDTEIDNLDDLGASNSIQSTSNETPLQFEDKSYEDEDFEMDNDVNDPDFTLKESDYVDGTSSSDSENSEIIPFYPMLERKRKSDTLPTSKVTKKRKKNSTLSETSNNIKLQPSRNEKGKRIWDKLHFCVYCEESFTNLLKHFLGRHKLEDEVKKIKDLPKSSKERSKAILKLRNAGDYKHNMAVLKSGSGTLITWSRKGDDYSPHDYLPCEDCLGFFLKDCLWRHRQKCPLKKDGNTQRKVQAGAYLMLPSSPTVTQGLKENVLKIMLADEISIAVRNDSLILKVGEKLFQKHGQHQHLYTYISQKMRELGRFLICARKGDPEIKCLNDIVRPEKFLKAVMATKDLCKYDEKTNTFGNPSLAMKLGHLLKQCARIKKSDGLVESESAKCKQADDFIILLENEWTFEVSSSALQTVHGNKRNQGQVLPLTKDIMKLRKYLVSLSSTLVASLKENFSKEAFEQLNQVTLARLVLFNRRRGGETQRLTIKAYSSRKTKASAMEEVEDILSDREKALCSTLTRIEIRGKKGRTVPVLITPDLESSISTLLDNRVAAGVNPENPYLFPRPNYDSCQPVRSTDALRKFAREAKLLRPETVTSTKLRKHIATVAQVLDLTEHDIETMSGFLGHDIRVHRDFYRLPQETMQVVKMGRLLNAVDQGTLGQYRGMALEDIPFEEDVELSSDQESDVDDGDNEEELFENENNAPERNSTQNQKPAVVRLSENQSRLLKSLFQTNVDLRRELRRGDCEKVILKYPELKNLTWTKIKNTVHNWITQEKRKLKSTC